MLEHGLSPRKQRPGGCPTCGGPDGTLRFDWVLATQDPESDFAPYASTLIEQKPLRSGSLYKCSHCGQKWWLDVEGSTMRLVPRERLLTLEQWSSIPLVLSPALLEKARTIGATPVHALAQEKEYAEVPCRVVTLRGENLEKCLLVFRKDPPLETGPLRLASELADLSPSDFALPLDVRRTSVRSQPGKAGRAPTRVRDPQGRAWNLDWVVNFVDQKGLRGCDLRLAAPGATPSKGRATWLQEPEGLPLFLADWDPRILPSSR